MLIPPPVISPVWRNLGAYLASHLQSFTNTKCLTVTSTANLVNKRLNLTASTNYIISNSCFQFLYTYYMIAILKRVVGMSYSENMTALNFLIIQLKMLTVIRSY